MRIVSVLIIAILTTLAARVHADPLKPNLNLSVLQTPQLASLGNNVPTQELDNINRRYQIKMAVGGVVLGIGVAGLLSGIAMFALDGQDYTPDPRYVWNTALRLGLPLTLIGIAASATGITLMAVAIKQRKAAIALIPGGFKIALNF